VVSVSGRCFEANPAWFETSPCADGGAAAPNVPSIVRLVTLVQLEKSSLEKSSEKTIGSTSIGADWTLLLGFDPSSIASTQYVCVETAARPVSWNPIVPVEELVTVPPWERGLSR